MAADLLQGEPKTVGIMRRPGGPPARGFLPGGFLLPFVEELGYPVPAFDFRVPGGAIAAAWAAMMAMGRSGYRERARVIMETTRRLLDGINAIPELEVIGRPPMSVFAYRSRVPAPSTAECAGLQPGSDFSGDAPADAWQLPQSGLAPGRVNDR